MKINKNRNKLIPGLLQFLVSLFFDWSEIIAIEVAEASTTTEAATMPMLEISYWTDSGIRCIVHIGKKKQEIFLQTPDKRELQKKLGGLPKSATTLRRAA